MTWMEHLAILEKHHTSGSTDELSYNVVFRLLNAADYGVPQIRQRVIIVGFRSDFNASWTFPEPKYSQEALLYSKWISKDYWEEHGIKVPADIPFTKEKRKVEGSPKGSIGGIVSDAQMANRQRCDR